MANHSSVDVEISLNGTRLRRVHDPFIYLDAVDDLRITPGKRLQEYFDRHFPKLSCGSYDVKFIDDPPYGRAAQKEKTMATISELLEKLQESETIWAGQRWKMTAEKEALSMERADYPTVTCRFREDTLRRMIEIQEPGATRMWAYYVAHRPLAPGETRSLSGYLVGKMAVANGKDLEITWDDPIYQTPKLVLRDYQGEDGKPERLEYYNKHRALKEDETRSISGTIGKMKVVGEYLRIDWPGCYPTILYPRELNPERLAYYNEHRPLKPNETRGRWRNDQIGTMSVWGKFLCIQWPNGAVTELAVKQVLIEAVPERVAFLRANLKLEDDEVWHPHRDEIGKMTLSMERLLRVQYPSGPVHLFNRRELLHKPAYARMLKFLDSHTPILKFLDSHAPKAPYVRVDWRQAGFPHTPPLQSPLLQTTQQLHRFVRNASKHSVQIPYKEREALFELRNELDLLLK